MINKAFTFDDVQIVPGYNPFDSRGDERISTSVCLGPYNFGTPIISANMDTITGPSMAKRIGQLGGLGILHRFCSIEENVVMFNEAREISYRALDKSCPVDSYPVGVSIGVNEDLNRVTALYKAGARIFCLDVAHGHSKLAGKQIKNMRQEFPDIFIIGGNVATFAGADYLASCGADAIKVGIGSGSICSTRIKTGIGVPQLSAILDCARCSKPIIADGGLRTPGDVCKALAAGAKMVMIGGMLSGCNETPGEELTKEHPYMRTMDGKCVTVKVKAFRGMASKEANEDQFGCMAEWKTAEGISTTVPCKGPVENVVKDIMGGLRSCMSYVGVHNLDELVRRSSFVQITQAGRIEATPHIVKS